MTAEPNGEPAGISGPAAVPGPEPDVYVLAVAQRRGDDVSVHGTEADAMAELAGYARESWHEITGTGPGGLRGVPAAPDGLDDDAVIGIYFAQRPDESWRIWPSFLPSRRGPGAFRLDEQKARAFLGRALRRWAGTLEEGEGAGAGPGENWLLEPGWDPRGAAADETGDAETLVYHAVHEAGALTTPPGVGIDLLVESTPGGDRMYDWRVSFPAGADFALCGPYRSEYRKIGWETDSDPRGKGARAALGILREAEEQGNRILAAHARGTLAAPAAGLRPPARSSVPGPGAGRGHGR